jgi:ribonuclease HI
MTIIAIDGACRRNGKPDCISAGGVFVCQINKDTDKFAKLSGYELNSTNQRGELSALILALTYIMKLNYTHSPFETGTQIITDSEYLFNSMTKEWYKNWQRKGWLTAVNEPVKNRDLWEKISSLSAQCEETGTEVNYYYIKGHCLSIGAVTAQTSLKKDTTGEDLYKLIEDQYSAKQYTPKIIELLDNAQTLSLKNNGFRLNDKTLRRFVVFNLMADRIATECADAANNL